MLYLKLRQTIQCFLLGGIALALSGCAGPLSTGASMQIDVEVYKGPLSKEPAAQWGELLGIIHHASSVLEFSEKQLKLSMVKDLKLNPTQFKECLKDNEDEIVTCCLKSKPKSKNPELCSRYDAMIKATQRAAENIRPLSKDAEDCNEDLKKFLNSDGPASPDDMSIRKVRGCYKNVLIDAVTFASDLSTAGFVVPESNVGFTAKERRIRSFQVSFANLASEFGNQISSRADSLLKQMRGENRRTMPVSLYLRDAGQTDFLNLYVWNYAGASKIIQEGLSQKKATRNRVRIVERLFADHNWAKINSVHASGQGRVRMAFIKDEIGNWNLKNFDNDPTELLDAYKKVGLAAIKTAADLAAKTSGAGASISAAQHAISFANQVALGGGSGEELAAESKTIEALHRRAVAQLKTLQKKIADRKAKLPEEIAAKKEQLDKWQKQKESLEKEIKELENQRPKEKPEDLRAEAIEAKGRTKEAEQVVSDTQKKIEELKGEQQPEPGPDEKITNEQRLKKARIESQIASFEEVKEQENEAAGEHKKTAEQKKIEATALTVKLSQIDKEINNKKSRLSPINERVVTLERELTNLQAEESTLPLKAGEGARKILNDHSALIDGLFEVSSDSGQEKSDENVSIPIS